ncbi:SusC/RagA family TonB-linked outer membrane protein [Proteiniphilum sp. UBA1028]|jgi:TonB-linked SusC/RagA family outer membrane protein|uniref:SusC/RagA family TonB-linked outer membrane protein n=1 Tax=Proteiniphilum sp. UBA1028 TaxID=1947251 RepID=UPI0025EC49B3|nr:TonB-dependent receptor [Proteiniphilum sp. UBA1028]
MKKRVLFLFFGLCFSIATFAQMQVRGNVTDSKRDPIPGVTVLLKGTQNGTTTDIDGNYKITVPGQGYVLVFSFVGMDTQEITIGNQTTINVALTETTTGLEEIVVVGYGTMRKSDVSGAVASVSSKSLQNLVTPDAAAALQGKASGVQVLTNSGAPGQGASIRVRGYSSNSDKIGPLLIVDGLQVDNIQYLDPSMIESIEILKDAASAAIYGAAAGNGVVLITTKSGASAKGTSSITYDVSYASQRLARHPQIFGAKDFIEYKKMSGLPIETQLEANGYDGTDTDWFDAVFEPSWSKKHTITFQGGNNQGNYFTSINYIHNDGIVKGDKDVYKRLSAQINADYNIKKWFQVGTNTSIEKWSTKSVPHMTQYGSLMNSVLTIDPLTPVYYSSPNEFAPTMKQAYDEGKIILKDPSNNLYYATSKYITDDSGNPLLQRDRVDRENGGVSLRGVLFGNLKPVKGLVITSRLGYRVAQSNEHSFSTPYYATAQAKSDDYNISANANTSLYYQFENFANYNLTIDRHNITAMGGMSYIENSWDNVSTSAQGPDILKGYEPNFRYIDYVKSNMVDGVEKTVKGYGNLPGKSTQISYFGRLVYSYDNRYTLQANFRADAFDSSKLPATNRWGYFPSFSAGWTISNESFFAEAINPDAFSLLKLRASWGQNGNINVLNNYKYSTTISYNSSWYQYGVEDGAPSYGSKPSGLANPNLKWETSEQLDLGVDLRFLKSRLAISADYFNKKTIDLLVDINPVPEIGVGSTTVNAGSVLNRGLELEASWKDLIGDFSYSISANFSTLHNEVTYLDPSISRLEGATGGVDGTNNPIRTAFEVGKPIWYFRGYKYDGVNPETGEAIIRDLNEDNQISDADMTYIGKAIPDYTYGLNLSLAYKGLDLNIFGAGVGGNNIFTVLYRADTPMRNSLKYYYDNAWTPENKNASMPDPKAVATDWHFWGSSASMFSGAYFKIKQIQLGYTIPEDISRKALIDRLRLYVSLDDFITFTNYPGVDPETATVSTAPQRAGFDNGTYPQSKKITFGLNITF